MIVLEGPDNAGKSTFARLLCDACGLHYSSAGPAPKTPDELQLCLNTQLMNASVKMVQDRLTCISQQVYNGSDDNLQKYLDLMLQVEHCIVIYCRPPDRILMDFSTHKVKSYDTEESLSKIVANQHRYIERYDALMKTIPHKQYDWTDEGLNLEGFIEMLYNTQVHKDCWRQFTNPQRFMVRDAL